MVVLQLAFLLFLATSLKGGEAATCTFLLPSSTNSSVCEAYDLSKIPSIGGANVTNGYSYVLTICENLPTSGLPLVCRSKQPAPGYQYDSSNCIIMGNLSAPFAVSVARASRAVLKVVFNIIRQLYVLYCRRWFALLATVPRGSH